MALANQTTHGLTLVDLDPARLAMAQHNVTQYMSHGSSNQTNITATCAAVEDIDLPTDATIHIDPDRRNAGKRLTNPQDYQPSLDWLESLTQRDQPILIKLAPGVDPDILPNGQWV